MMKSVVCEAVLNFLNLFFDVPLKQASKSRDKLWLLLMSYTGSSVCGSKADDMKSFYGEAEEATAGQLRSQS